MDHASLGRMMVFYLLKFGISVAVLFLSLVQFGLDPLGILIGLSTVVEAIVLNTILQTLIPPKRQTEAG
jgi:hypothetical protein